MVLLLSDGLMCVCTGFAWLLQRAILDGPLDWNISGWIIQLVSTLKTSHITRIEALTGGKAMANVLHCLRHRLD